MALSLINHKNITMKRVESNGVKIYPFTSFEQLLQFVEEKKGILVAINAEKILHATEQTRTIINRNIGYCDGVGALMVVRKHGCHDAMKIPGCVLWLRIIASTWQEVIEATVEKLRGEFEGIRIVGARNGYIKSEEEKLALIEDIAARKPDVVFVAMGSPRQELLMEEMLSRHQAVYQGLGGSFDVYTGRVRRAPVWWQEHGLEWLYRLINDPSRIKRQIYLFWFLWKVRFGNF